MQRAEINGIFQIPQSAFYRFYIRPYILQFILNIEDIFDCFCLVEQPQVSLFRFFFDGKACGTIDKFLRYILYGNGFFIDFFNAAGKLRYEYIKMSLRNSDGHILIYP